MKKLFYKIKEYTSIPALIIFFLTIISALILIIETFSVSFADFVNTVLTRPTRAIMAWISGWLPLSLAELLIITAPIWIFILIFIGVKKSKKGLRATTRYIAFLVCIPCFIFISFVWTYSSGYYNTGLDKRLDFENVEIGKEELYETSLWMRDNLNSLADNINYGSDNASYTELSYDELSKIVCSSYSSISKKYGVVHTFPSRIKPIMLSEPMTYTHISGIYSFMTGEANLNVNYPKFITVSSLAHEFAHQRGFAREEEANFMSFLVCTESDNDFVKYSGYLDVFLDVINDLYQLDKGMYDDVISGLDKRVKNDIASYGKFFEKYSDSKASDIAGSMNDKYLQMNGQENGVKSYGMVTDLSVRYYYTLIKR